MADPIAWWQTPEALLRWLADVVRAEAQALRPGLLRLPGCGMCWSPEQRLDSFGLGLDSLERLQIAAALSEALHMHRSGMSDLLLVHTTVGEWCGIAAASLRSYSERLTFRSSGSRGAPKSVGHALADLEAEAAGHAALLGGGARRVLSAVPCHHIYGFIFTVLLPRWLDATVTDLRAGSPGAAAALAQPGDVLVGYPEFWSAVLRSVSSEGAGGFRHGVTGVSSTAPLPDATADGLLAAGLSRLIQVHGASETAGLGTRERAADPYTLLPAWQRSQDGGLARRPHGSEMVDPPDRLQWLDARRYHLAGRQDGAVQIGGVNVWPDQVEAALCEHSAVAAAAVRLMHPSEGGRLKAFIVPRDPDCDAPALQAALQAFAGNFPPYQQPRAYTIGPALPTTAMGKLMDWPIAQREG